MGLLALNTMLGWVWYREWQAFKSRTQWIYTGPTAESAEATTSQTAAGIPQSFTEIVERNLFHPDRTSPGGQEGIGAAEPPVLYGTMNLGAQWFALMAPAEQAATGVFKRVYPGEEIGGYKLVEIRGTEVVVESGGTTLTLNVAESSRRVARSPEKTPAARPAAPRPTGGARPASPVTTAAPVVGTRQATTDERRKFGPAGYNAPPGAPVDAPAGTVFRGKRKVVRRTPFGEQIWWEEIERPEPQDERQDEKKEN
jgi:hypothetical protein